MKIDLTEKDRLVLLELIEISLLVLNLVEKKGLRRERLYKGITDIRDKLEKK